MTFNPDLLSTSLKMLASLAFVLGAMFVAFHFIKKLLNQRGPKRGGRLIRILANTYIGMKKSISLVEVPGAVLIIGISNENISLLGKIDNEEFLNSLENTETSPIQETFFNHIQNWSQKLSKHEKKETF